MRTTMTGAHGAVLRAIRQRLAVEPLLRSMLADGADPDRDRLVIEDLASESWQSATFRGHRHRLEIAVHGRPGTVATASERITRLFDDADLPIRDGCLIECVVDAQRTHGDARQRTCRISFGMLTLED